MPVRTCVGCRQRAQASELLRVVAVGDPSGFRLVPDYQLSLAIGREGQNARLAARLTGWRIDIRSDAAPAEADAGAAAPAAPAGGPRDTPPPG